jgi:carbamate kinase
MIEKLAIVAIGGNSIVKQRPDTEYQKQAIEDTCRHIADMIVSGWQVVVTHGNGPQVGFMLRRSEYAQAHGIHPLPLDTIVATTQGILGYMLQQSLDNELRRRGINRTCATVLTQIRVENDDPAFDNPTKPIGGFMTEAEARESEAQGWQVMEDAGRGWRRVVASPHPRYIQEINAIQGLMLNGYVVIAAGGGGIPVIRDETGNLEGVYAVIDKDRASSLLAQTLRADLLIISTAVEKVALNFNTPDQIDLNDVTLKEARQYLADGHFAAGSMRPKVEAAIEFVERGGPQAIITDPANLTRAVHGNGGTRIIPG